MKKICGVVYSLLLLCVAWSGCINQAEDDSQKYSAELTIGISEDPQGFFPWIESYDVCTLGINFNIFNPLVEFDSSFKLFPKLAKSWNNPDNCTWRFFLRDDVKFHNGDNFTAADVKFTIDLIKSNKTHVLWDLLTEVKEVVVIDEHTVDFVTYQPFPILLNKLTNIPIASKTYIENTNNTKWPIGTGAYKFLEHIPGNHLTLVRFDDYAIGEPVIQKVIYQVIQKSEDRKNALIAGQVDILEHVPEMYVNEILNTSGITIKKISNPTVFYIGFDFRNNSSNYPGMKNPLTDVRVRQALYHAINVNNITQILGLSAEPASQFLSPLIFGYNPQIKRLPFDLNMSRQILAEAGYEHGFNITLECPESYLLQKGLSEEIIRQLSQVVNATLLLLDSEEEYYTRLSMGNSSLYFLGWIPATGDGGEIFDYLLRSENHPLGRGSYNFGFYSNKTIDNITSQISYSMNQKTRMNLMHDGFKVAMDDVACIPLYINVCNVAFPEYLEWSPRSDLSTLVEEITVK